MYRKTIRVCATAVILLSALRLILKLMFIDQQTGLYTGAPLMPLIFTLAAAFALIEATFFTLRESDRGISGVRGNRALEIAGIIFAGAVIVACVMQTVAIFGTASSVNMLSLPLRLIEQVLGIASGICMMLIATAAFGGAMSADRGGCLALVIVIWSALRLVDRFMGMRQVTTVSDQLMEVLALVAGLLFWLEHSRCVAGYQPRRRRVLLYAAPIVILGIPLVFGQFCAAFALGFVTGPNGKNLLITAAMCIYVAVFSVSITAQPEKSPSFEEEESDEN